MIEESKEISENNDSKNVEESKQLEKLSDDDIKWRAKYKLTKSEYEEAKLNSEKEKTGLIEKIDSTTKEKQLLENKLVQAELKAASVAAGIKDLDLIKLIDTSHLKINENGTIEGIEQAVQDFKSKKPDFFGTDKKISSSTNSAAGNSESKSTALDARNMSNEEWNKNRQRFMAGNFS